MTDDQLVIRSMHDVGLAAWFGGSLMGAVGLNGAAKDVRDTTDRTRVAAAGWARWAPVNAAAIGVHLLGGGALTVANRGRVAVQRGTRWNTAIKTIVTGGALGATAYSGWLGDRTGRRRARPAPGDVCSLLTQALRAETERRDDVPRR